MVKVSYSLDEGVLNTVEAELAALGAGELEGSDNILKASYLDGNVTCTLTVDDKQARFTVTGTEGVFRDVFLPLNKSVRFYTGREFDFLCSLEKKIIFVLKKDSYVEGSVEVLIAYLKGKSAEMTTAEISALKQAEADKARSEQLKNARKFYGRAQAEGDIPKRKTSFREKFRPQGYFAIAFAIFAIIDSFDGTFFYGDRFSPMGTLTSALIGLVIGFFFSFTYTFFRAWFDGQQEKVRVGSIALFFITFPAFILMGVLGAVPYSVYQLVDGKRNRGVEKVINVAVPIFMGLVLILELGLLYLVIGLGMFS